MPEIDDSIQLEKGLIAWIEAQPNSTEIKAWVLAEHARRCDWQDDCGIFDERALNIEWDVLDALFCMSGLRMPFWSISSNQSISRHMPHDSTRCCVAYFSLLVYLRRQSKEVQS
jgi:hypothetical protein